jgi:2,3-bisphosphoglycerate-independent phosphoglycerate mutase
VAVLPFDPAHRKSELCDSVQSFDEVSAARGSLGRFLGAGVMQLLRRVAERAAVSGSNRGNV